MPTSEPRPDLRSVPRADNTASVWLSRLPRSSRCLQRLVVLLRNTKLRAGKHLAAGGPCLTTAKHTLLLSSCSSLLRLSLSPPPLDGDGDGSSLTASLSDTHGEDSPLPMTYMEEAEEGEQRAHGTEADGDDHGDGAGAGANEAPAEAARAEDERQPAGGGAGCGDGDSDSDGDGDADVTGSEGGAAGILVDGGADGGAAGRPGAGLEDGDAGPPRDPTGASAGGAGDRDLLDRDPAPEGVLEELSLEGTKALECGSCSSLSDGDAAGATGAIAAAAATSAAATAAVTGVGEDGADSPGGAGASSVARSLFGSGVEDGDGGKKPLVEEGLGAKKEDAKGGDLEDLPVVPSKEELELKSRCKDVPGKTECFRTVPARAPLHSANTPLQ